MSLLHDALKKASRTESPPEQGVFVDHEEVVKGASPRVILLLSVAAACLLFVATIRFFRKAGGESLAPKKFTTPLDIAGGPAASELSVRGQDFLQAGKYEEARVVFEKSVILEPRNAEAYNNLGLALKKLGKNDEAFDQYRKALSLNPQCVECTNNLGVLYLSNRDLVEAENQFRKAMELKGDYAEPYFHMGLLLEARGDLSGAKKNLLKYVELAKGVDASFLLKVQQRIASLETP